MYSGVQSYIHNLRFLVTSLASRSLEMRGKCWTSHEIGMGLLSHLCQDRCPRGTSEPNLCVPAEVLSWRHNVELCLVEGDKRRSA
eukprot:g44714.t1